MSTVNVLSLSTGASNEKNFCNENTQIQVLELNKASLEEKNLPSTESVLTNARFKISVFPKNTRSSSKKQLPNEARKLRQLQHPAITKFLSIFQDENCYYMVTEFFSNKTLEDVLSERGRFKEEEVAHITKQLVKGLMHSHQKRIAHSNITLKTILVNDTLEVKFSSFGMASKLLYPWNRVRKEHSISSYSSPEQIERKEGLQSDVWSLGVVCFALLTGKLPFENVTETTTLDSIKNGIFSFPTWIPISSAAKDFVAKILVRNPKRMTLKKLLNHPFMEFSFHFEANTATKTIATELNQERPIEEPVVAGSIDCSENVSLPGAGGTVAFEEAPERTAVATTPRKETPSKQEVALSPAKSVPRNQITTPTTAQKLSQGPILSPTAIPSVVTPAKLPLSQPTLSPPRNYSIPVPPPLPVASAVTMQSVQQSIPQPRSALTRLSPANNRNKLLEEIRKGATLKKTMQIQKHKQPATGLSGILFSAITSRRSSIEEDEDDDEQAQDEWI